MNFSQGYIKVNFQEIYSDIKGGIRESNRHTPISRTPEKWEQKKCN